jgi:hypothetical protein
VRITGEAALQQAGEVFTGNGPIAKDFQNLTHYCANDCEATFEVYVKVDKYVWRGQGRMEMG